MKIHTVAHLGDNNDLAKEWLQLVRAFDVAHPGECMIQIFIEAPSATVAEMEAVLDAVDPPLPHRMTLKKR